MSEVRIWKLVLFGLLAGLIVCWVFATPIFGTSDESAHVIKAAAVVRGELVGTPVGGPSTIVVIPQGLVGANPVPCFALHPTLSAGCVKPLSTDNGLVSEKTWTGYYPPLYYLLVGWPSRLCSGVTAVYAMRLISGLLGAVFLAGAFFSAIQARSRALLVPAVAAMTTPYLFAYIGSVNPSGLEMASSLCAWTAGIALVDRPSDSERRQLLIRFALSLAVLSQLRDLGPLFVVAIVFTLMNWYGVRRSWLLVRRPGARLIVIGIGICAAFTVFWVLIVGSLSFLPSNQTLPPHAGLITILAQSVWRYGNDLRQLVGNFGWTDTYPPVWVSALGLGVMASLAVIGIRRAQKRLRLIVMALLVFSVLLPIILIAHEAGSVGILGQGRYWFPLLAGVVLASAGAGGSSVHAASWRLWATVAVTAVVIDIVCFQVALDRFRFGLGQPEVRAGWNPPGGAEVWPVLSAAMSVLFAWWWWQRRRDEGPIGQLQLSDADSGSSERDLPYTGSGG